MKYGLVGVCVLLLLTPALAQTPAPKTPPAKTPPAQAPEAPDAAIPIEMQKFTGDYDEMRKRRLIRVGVPYNRTHYFIDRGIQRGVAYDAFKIFENDINASIKQPKDKIHVIFVPISRDEMGPALRDGRVDVLAATLTITPERRKIADWSDPIRQDVAEVVVTGPGAPAIATKADLAGKEVFVRENSNYHQHLLELNTRLKAQGQPEVIIKTAPMNLEDDDILEMVNAGLAKITVVDNFLAEFWVTIFPNLKLLKNVALVTDQEIGLAMRPNSPQMKAAMNAFIKKHGMGTLNGNMLMKKYLVSTKFVKNAASEADRKRFQQIVELFRKYGGQYNMDFLLMAAQGYQESGLNQTVKSPVGAIGVMQVMPATGKDMNVGDITELENNIHAGVKYMRFMIDRYYKDEPMDDLNKGLMAFASYNAGPGRMRQLRAETKKRGLNENVWFNNVEQIVSERIGRETVTYVSNIYKYYIAYRLAMDEMAAKRKATGGL